MTRWVGLLLAAGALIGAVSLASRGRAGGRAASRPVLRGLAIGDSLTANQGYVRFLQERTGAPWDVRAEVGLSSWRVLRLVGTIPPGYSHVVVLAGVNDGNASASRTIESLAAIYRLAKASGAQVVGVAETPWRGYAGLAQRPGAWQRHLLARQWVLGGGGGLLDRVVDSYQVLEDPSRPGFLKTEFAAPDQLHLNAQGQRALGALILARLS